MLTIETEILSPGDPRQRNPNAPKFEDRSLEETECPRSSVEVGQNIFKILGEKKTAVFSPSENWCLPGQSNLKPEEREFVVDSGASMHMISKKDLNSAEMDALTKSCCPTMVITADGGHSLRQRI